jgi:hypothetical protein
VDLTGAGPITFVGDNYGLSTYLTDNIENSGTVNDPALTVAQATGAAAAIEGQAAVGGLLDDTTIDAFINAEAGVVGAGLAVGNSSGLRGDILRILSGERYKVDAGATVADGTPTFVPGRRGYFTTAANVVENLLHPGGRGGQEPIAGRTATQTPPEDVEHIAIRPLEETSAMHLSALDGRLGLMGVAAYMFNNPDFTYGAAGTALTLAGANIGTDYAARAVTVYKADGTVLI